MGPGKFPNHNYNQTSTYAYEIHPFPMAATVVVGTAQKNAA